MWCHHRAIVASACLLGIMAHANVCAAQSADDQRRIGRPVQSLVSAYCLDCHNSDDKSGNLDLQTMVDAHVNDHADDWERVFRKLHARHMPPPDAPRPGDDEYSAAVDALVTRLDTLAAQHPRPGRTPTFRRLTRTEYQNAIRDLLSVHIDAAALLPMDEPSHGFDNVTVGDLSPTLLNRYISAAQQISRLAVGNASDTPQAATFRVRPDLTQDVHIPGLPIGTRGGTLIRYTFPQDGEYEIRVRLARDRNEEVEGLRQPHELEILLDRLPVERLLIKPPKEDSEHATADAHLAARVQVTAGLHDVGVTFLNKSNALQETLRQPYQSHFNMHRHPRLGPAVYQVSITGPHTSVGPGTTASRENIFVCRPSSSDDELACAEQILSRLMRRAWRRPITGNDLAGPLKYFHQARADGDFEDGIQFAVASILVSPQFLFRIERDPADVEPQTAYRVSDVELASRLSFFLWSSIPDDELLQLAERNELSRPETLKQQVARMLADPRADALITNFAGQWLYLRNLDSVTPDMRLFPDFDDNLRQAMRRETELLFDNVMRNNRSVLALLSADYTYLNERLARHYGIPHVLGSQFRRVALDADSHRGGILRHSSILTVTSYATRTSPVIRGQWILKNMLGAPPPPPPPNVPALTENSVAASLPVRERLAQHRADATCASCHNLIDPVGFALENFDAIGRWREIEAGVPVDAGGGLPDGSTFTGVDGLERELLRRPELFVGTMAEKLLTFALGRGVETHDAAAVRSIVRQAAADEYRFASLVQAIVESPPFQMRMSP